jgi:hypothetical protein
MVPKHMQKIHEFFIEKKSAQRGLMKSSIVTLCHKPVAKISSFCSKAEAPKTAKSPIKKD